MRDEEGSIPISESFEGGQFVTALGALHFNFHPDKQAVAVVVVVAGSLHQFLSWLEVKFSVVLGRVQGQLVQANRALLRFGPFFKIKLFSQEVVVNWFHQETRKHFLVAVQLLDHQEPILHHKMTT